MTPTCVYDSYWRFAAERQAMYLRRVRGEPGPWTQNAVLKNYRFTNAFRAADRVSQYLISEIQYNPDRSPAPTEVFFRTILFKIFNKRETWEYVERAVGPISYQSTSLEDVNELLDGMIQRGKRIYSAAYIMPAPSLGHVRKHSNHLALLQRMMDDGLAAKVERAKSLRAVFELLRVYPGLGPFLAFQYAVDLNYSTLVEFSESEFVVAGPGALDGISKCFEGPLIGSPEDLIYEMVDRQQSEFKRLDLDFEGLFGRPLQPIDCQNLFCEISKYARVAHPAVKGLSGRTRIKQSFKPDPSPLPSPRFPPRWGISPPSVTSPSVASNQLDLWN